MGRSWRWRGKREGLIVQLKGWAKVESWALRRLHDNAAFAIRKLDDRLHVAFVILVHLYATFWIQYLIQPFPRARLLRRFLSPGEQQAWPDSSNYDNEADSDPLHGSIIQLTFGCSKLLREERTGVSAEPIAPFTSWTSILAAGWIHIAVCRRLLTRDLFIGSHMITQEFAVPFAKDWIASWNSHDLERILSHYSDDFEMSSPYIAQMAGEPSGVLKGKAAVAAYWSHALEQLPTLHFELHSVLVGAGSLVIYYQGVNGMAAEMCVFDARGKVAGSHAHYAAQV